MLHKSKSKRKNKLKVLLIIPALALFLISFNSREVYVLKDNGTPMISDTKSALKTINLKIDKNTSDKELLEMKQDLNEKGIDFSYTVVHNEKKEIIEISIHMRGSKKEGKEFQGSSTFNNDGQPIDPITIVFDEDENMFFMGNGKGKTEQMHGDSKHNVWVHSDDEDQEVEIRIDNGKEVIIVNGKEITKEDLQKIHADVEVDGKHIKVHKSTNIDSEVIIISESDVHDDRDVKVISEDGHNFFVIDSQGEEGHFYVIDGKESSLEDFKQVAPKDIKNISVIKGEKAVKKYGEKAREGAIEITTKKKD